MEDKIQTTYTSWSALLYIRAFWNINIMSLWNSLVVRIVWNNRINAIIISEKKKTCSKWKFTRRSLPHFQCSFLLSIDPWACRTRKQSQYFSDGSYNYRVFLISNEIDSNAKQVVHVKSTYHKHSWHSDSHCPISNTRTTRLLRKLLNYYS